MNNKWIFFTVCGIIWSMYVGAQNPKFEWAVSMADGSSSGVGLSIISDRSANILSTGFFHESVDFDPGPGAFLLTTVGPAPDIYIQKLDPDGNFLWAKAILGNGGNFGYGIITDASDNVYVTGMLDGTADFDPGPGTFSLTGYGKFVLKLDPAGDFIWAKFTGGKSASGNHGMALDTLGNIYLAGYFDGTVDFDPGPATFQLTSLGSSDVFVQKLDTSGNLIWVHGLGGPSTDIGEDVITDAAGNAYVSGIFYDTIEVDPGPGTTLLSSNGWDDIFLLKFNPSGELVWANSRGGPYEDRGTSLDVDPPGNVYLTGTFQDLVDFDPGPGMYMLTAEGFYDMFVQKMDTAGNFLWAKAISTLSDGVDANGLVADASGNIYLTGMFNGAVDFDPGPGKTILSGSKDIFFLNLASSGDFGWATSVGGTGTDDGISITTYGQKNILTTGFFSGAVDFDPGPGTAFLNAGSSSSIFVFNLSQCPATIETLNPVACDSYISPSGHYLWTVSGTYVDTLLNAGGCDSVLTINLTINNVDTAVTQWGSDLTATANDATFQWMDCGNGYASIDQETHPSFSPLVNGEYAVEITQNNCVDTSSCYVVSNVGIYHDGFEGGLSLFPNPTTGHLTIDLGQISSGIILTVRNIQGQVIKSVNAGTTRTLSLDIEEPGGIYLIEIQTLTKNRTVIKVLKE